MKELLKWSWKNSSLSVVGWSGGLPQNPAVLGFFICTMEAFKVIDINQQFGNLVRELPALYVLTEWQKCE